MSSTSWEGASGDWNTASNWTNGVPHSSSTALVTADGPYIVTSSRDNAVKVLEMSPGATLSIKAHNVSVTESTGGGAFAGSIEITASATALVLGTYDQSQNGGNTAYKNTGTISIQRGGSSVKDAVVLNGSGKIIFSNRGKIEAFGNLGQITSENRISGVGVIGAGADHPYLIFINAPNGVIDADGDTLLIDVGTAFINNGTMQASTDLGILSIIGAITNNGLIAAAAAGAAIQLAGAQINGGSVQTVAGATLLAQEGTNEINTTTPIANAGTIATDGGTLTIVGAVNNSTGSGDSFNSLAVTDYMRITGEVTGGRATIYENGEFSLAGATSMDVLFDSGSTGVLVLGAPDKFAGTIFGMDTNPNVRIDLINIPFSDNVSISVAGGFVNSVLTVHDATQAKTFSINIAGNTFIKKKAHNGSTLLFCEN